MSKGRRKSTYYTKFAETIVGYPESVIDSEESDFKGAKNRDG